MISPTEVARHRELVKMKRRATGMLVLVAVAFVLVVVLLDEDAAFTGYLLALTEGSMVGGLADWFAVTALFRHPLGLPIPHTAVVRERKDQFGETLGSFVQENFLSPENVVVRVRAAKVPLRIAAWMSNRANAESAAASAADGLLMLADAVRDEDAHRLLHEEIERAIVALDVAPAAGRMLRAMTRDGRHNDLFDTLLRTAATFLDDHREVLRARFGEESPWWLPGAVEDRIFDRLIDGTIAFLEAAAVDPHHELRTSIEERLASLASRLEGGDPELTARVSGVVRDFATHPELRRFTSELWADAKAALREAAADPSSRLRVRLADAVVAVGQRLGEDRVLQDRVDAVAEAAVRYAASNYRDEIASLVSGAIARWDGEETSNKLELLLGRDLQFIRINGTVVGGLAGIAIHAASTVL